MRVYRTRTPLRTLTFLCHSPHILASILLRISRCALRTFTAPPAPPYTLTGVPHRYLPALLQVAAWRNVVGVGRRHRCRIIMLGR